MQHIINEQVIGAVLLARRKACKGAEDAKRYIMVRAGLSIGVRHYLECALPEGGVRTSIVLSTVLSSQYKYDKRTY